MFKSYRLIEGKITLVLVDEDGNIINKNPNKEELKNLLLEKRRVNRRVYNRTNSCDSCGNKLLHHNGHREYNNEGNWTGKWLCRSCSEKMLYSHNSIKKMLTDRRIGNIKYNSNNIKGDFFQKLTCEWLGVKDLNIENDNYKSPIDHSRHPILGVVQTSGRFLTFIHDTDGWGFNASNDHNKQFDNKICYCTDKDGQTIERVYIFPRNEIMIRTSITIKKLPIYNAWYEKYKITDKDLLNNINVIWKKIITSGY